jgi:protein TonB
MGDIELTSLNLNRYIVFSALTHLLLFGLLLLMNPAGEKGISAIDVGIVAYLDTPDTPSVKSSKPILKKRIRPARPDINPETLDEELKPDAIEGDAGSLLHKAPLPSGPGGEKKLDKEDSGRESETDDLQNLPTLSAEEEGSGTSTSPRNFLFDRETIEKYAKKPSRDDRSHSFDAPGFKHRGYMRLLKQKIERIWEYPDEMARRGVSGDLFITFVINKDGSLGDIRLVRTSGHRELDEAAIKALKDAEPFWPLPDNWEKDGFEINGHFIYLPGSTYLL